MGFRVARRLAGGGLAGSSAGIAAAVAIALSPQYLRGLSVATSEGSLMALSLLAVERHLEGRHRQAFVVIFLVGLVRPDSWPIMALYGLWLIARRRAAWPMVLGLGALAPALWFLPEWWGSGDPLRAGHLASEPVQNTYSVDPHPVRAALEGAWDPRPGDLGGRGAGGPRRGRAVGAPALAPPARPHRPGGDRHRVAGGGDPPGRAGPGSGTPRYFMGSAALLAVVGAAGWGLAIRAAATAPRTPAVARAAAAGVAAAALVAALAAYGVHQRDELRLTADNARWLAASRDDLPKVIAAARARRIVRCGTTSSRKIQIPELAWYLHVGVPQIDWRRVHRAGLRVPGAHHHQPPVPPPQPPRIHYRRRLEVLARARRGLPAARRPDARPRPSLARIVSTDSPSLGSTDERFSARELLRNGLTSRRSRGFAFTEPLLTLLGSNPAFFAAHESSRWDVILFGVVVAFGPPIVLVAIEALAGLIHPRARTPVHLVLMTALAALFALRGLRTMSARPPGSLIAALIGGRSSPSTWWSTARDVRQRAVDRPRPVPGHLHLLLASAPAHDHGVRVGVRRAEQDLAADRLHPVRRRPPMDPDGHIDKRFPNFARLADTATWYRNATTAHENTTWSIPSIVDGRWPNPKWQPILADHPNNLFTLLGKRSRWTSTSPRPTSARPAPARRSGTRAGATARPAGRRHQRGLPAPGRAQAPGGHPPVDRHALVNFRESDAKANVAGPQSNRAARQRSARGDPARADRAHAARQAAAALLHPHPPAPRAAPVSPTGASTRRAPTPSPRWMASSPSTTPYLDRQALQRALSRSASPTGCWYADPTDHLQRVGLWKKALVIITADHGEAFQRATGPIKRYYNGRLSWRRAITPANMGWVAAVPLIVKYPDQAQGRIDDRPVKTIDVLPTIAATLGIKMPFKVDGRSLRDPSYHGRDPVRVERTGGQFLSRPAAAVRAQRDAAVATIAGLFGADTGTDALYRIGPDPELHGRDVSGLPVDRGGPLRASLERASQYARGPQALGVRPRAGDRTPPRQFAGRAPDRGGGQRAHRRHGRDLRPHRPHAHRASR